MAGRKPRVPRDEAAGVSPLKAQHAGAVGDAAGGGLRPARGYSWPPFQPGHKLSVTHGAYSPSVVMDRATAILTWLLEDAGMPPHVRSAGFRPAAVAYARAEAVSELLFEHLARMDPAEMMLPQRVAVKSPADIWKTADAHAARLRNDLGISPVGYARLAKDLGIAGRAAEDALQRMASDGAAVTARRLGPGLPAEAGQSGQ